MLRHINWIKDLAVIHISRSNLYKTPNSAKLMILNVILITNEI